MRRAFDIQSPPCVKEGGREAIGRIVEQTARSMTDGHTMLRLTHYPSLLPFSLASSTAPLTRGAQHRRIFNPPLSGRRWRRASNARRHCRNEAEAEWSRRPQADGRIVVQTARSMADGHTMLRLTHYPSLLPLSLASSTAPLTRGAQHRSPWQGGGCRRQTKGLSVRGCLFRQGKPICGAHRGFSPCRVEKLSLLSD